MEDKMIFTAKESRDYRREYADNVFISSTPNNLISLDFYEEYMESTNILTGEDEQQQEFIDITRLKKVAVLLNKKDALNLAERIMEMHEEDLFEADSIEGEN